MWQFAVIVMLVNSFLGVSGNANGTILSLFDSHKVVSDVIPVAPREMLNVTYSNATVNLGDELTPTQVTNEPTLTWNAAVGQYYTLIFTDADAPSRNTPEDRQMLHWLVGNIPGSNVSAGDIIAEYIGPGPGEGSGLHRYVLLVYQQPSKLTFDELRMNNTSPAGRPRFSTNQFAYKYNLSDPVAGNFFQAQYDSSVPLLYKQLGILINSTDNGSTNNGTSTTAAPSTNNATSNTAAPSTINGTSTTAAPTTTNATSTTVAPSTINATSTTAAPATTNATSSTAAPLAINETSSMTAPTATPVKPNKGSILESSITMLLVLGLFYVK
ncbi:OV-16 antigen-like [Hyposmocoma kahamanoa]|uniref:OV-16 antigen-like n=1 Tax=Hyposmocoma kahamanoa TaxID=1477025 RepID=UPI000E6D7F8C|nr:OV-16 antigen-like [Hyposmocoma kahamanoa]